MNTPNVILEPPEYNGNGPPITYTSNINPTKKSLKIKIKPK